MPFGEHASARALNLDITVSRPDADPNRISLRVDVDSGRCQGHARCRMEAPEVFDHNLASGVAQVISPLVPVAFEARVRRAFASCPERAIRLEELTDRPQAG